MSMHISIVASILVLSVSQEPNQQPFPHWERYSSEDWAIDKIQNDRQATAKHRVHDCGKAFPDLIPLAAAQELPIDLDDGKQSLEK